MLKKITAENFRPYGWVIEYPNKHLKGKTKNLWKILVTESEPVGWRLAYLVVRDKFVTRLECHPNTYESFEPVKGISLFYVATDRDLRTMECFLLSKPVILKKGVWHANVTLSPETEIKICENAEVDTEFWPLEFKLPTKKEMINLIKEKV